MTVKVARLCSMAGCGEQATYRGQCAGHARERDVNRGTPTYRGYGSRHEEWRARILARDPVCVMCWARPSTVADHVVALAAGGTWDEGNGQGLCAGCHGRKTAAVDGGFGRVT